MSHEWPYQNEILTVPLSQNICTSSITDKYARRGDVLHCYIFMFYMLLFIWYEDKCTPYETYKRGKREKNWHTHDLLPKEQIETPWNNMMYWLIIDLFRASSHYLFLSKQLFGILVSYLTKFYSGCLKFFITFLSTLVN